MSAVSSLVPARFLTIIAHLVIVITIFWSRVCEMVNSCLEIQIHSLLLKSQSFALTCLVNRRTMWGPHYLWILRKSNMTAKIKSKYFLNSVKNTSYYALNVTIVLSSEVGNCVGGDHRYVRHRADWFLHRSVHVQLQPRSTVYPLKVHYYLYFNYYKSSTISLPLVTQCNSNKYIIYRLIFNQRSKTRHKNEWKEWFE